MRPPTILVATWDAGLFAVAPHDRPAQEIATQPVRGLAPDGRGGALAIVDGHSLYRRTATGGWSVAATSEFALSCCMAVADEIYVGTDDARLLRLTNGAALHPIESFDHVAGRETWYAGSAIVNGQRVGPPLGIRSVAANSNGSVLFANVHVGGIPRSTDGGKTWQPTIDIHSDVHEVRAHPEQPNIVAAAAGVGLCISRDAGATWSTSHTGLHAPHCSAVAFSGDAILVSAAASPFAPEGRIYRRPLNSEGVLEAIENGLPEWTAGIVHTGCLATNGPTIAAADRSGSVYVSNDFGHSWSYLTTGLPPPSSVLICPTQS